jgi:hypothetical protein
MLGLIDRSAVVEPNPFEVNAPIPGTALPAQGAELPATPASETNSIDLDAPKATAVMASPDVAEPKEELAVIASNGHATNGHAANGNGKPGNSAGAITLNLGNTKVSFQTQADAPSCADCGSIMVRNGSCYKCLNCGSTSGCS